MGELVDNDGLQGLGWREDEPPREGQPAGARGAPPARPRVSHRDADGSTPSAVGVASMSRVDRPARRAAVSHASRIGTDRAPVAATRWMTSSSLAAPPMPLDPDDPGPPARPQTRGARRGTDPRPVAGTAARPPVSAGCGPAGREVATQPRLALGEERGRRRSGSAAVSPGGRDGHDDPTVRVDDDPQRPRDRGEWAERVGRAARRAAGRWPGASGPAPPATVRVTRRRATDARPLAGLGALDGSPAGR